MCARKLSVCVLAAALLLLAATLTSASPAAGPDAPDAGFTIQKDVVGAGGPHSYGEASDLVFELDGTAGQPAAGRTANDSTGLALQAGFWSACAAEMPAPPEPVAQLAGVANADVQLDWPAETTDAAYQVWVSDAPYFSPDEPGGAAALITDLLTFTDPAAAANLANHFYVLRGLNTCGAASTDSQRLGEFTFGLTPGG